MSKAQPKFVFRPWITLANGTVIYAKHYGKRAFKIPVSDNGLGFLVRHAQHGRKAEGLGPAGQEEVLRHIGYAIQFAYLIRYAPTFRNRKISDMRGMRW